MCNDISHSLFNDVCHCMCNDISHSLCNGEFHVIIVVIACVIMGTLSYVNESTHYKVL